MNQRTFYTPHETQEPDIEPPARYVDTTCKAHGCPLPGAFTDSTQGTNSWLCWIHDRIQVPDWQVATNEIRRNAWVIAVLKVVAGWQPFDQGWREGARRAAVKMEQPDLAPRDGESQVAFCTRLRKVITGRVLALCGKREEKRDAAKPHEPWKQVAALVQNGPPA